MTLNSRETFIARCLLSVNMQELVSCTHPKALGVSGMFSSYHHSHQTD